MAEDIMLGAALERRGELYEIHIREMPIPPVGDGEVLVEVHAAAVSHMDETFIHGLANERLKGLRSSLAQDVLTGIELSGVVASNGRRFRKGDEVVGYIHILRDRRTHAQFTALPEQALASKPSNLTFVEAAAMPAGCLTAYEALTNVAKAKAGDRILIIGAAGSVGVHTIQLARHLGCHVVAVCNPAIMNQAKLLGANEVVDYNSDVLSLRPVFDIVFDTAPAYSFKQCEPMLRDGGTYIHTLPSKDAKGFELAAASTKNAGYLMVLEVKDDALERVSKLMQEGVFSPVIDQVFQFRDIARAFERFSARGKVGKVVVDISAT